MASGAFYGDKQGHYSVYILWSSAPIPEKNSSLVVMDVYITYQVINISGRTGTTSIGGVEAKYTTPAINDNSNSYDAKSRFVVTRRMEVAHENDGNGKVYIWASFPFNLNSGSAGRVNELYASGWITLDSIPRASTIDSSSASVTVDGTNAYQLTMRKANDAFRHKAALNFGEYGWTSDPFDTTLEYIIPAQWLNAIPDQMQAAANVSVQTYSDEACTEPMGDPVETTVLLQVPSSPPVAKDGWAQAEPVSANQGASSMGIYVQGLSGVRITFDNSRLSARYGAQIASVVVTAEGLNYPVDMDSAQLQTAVLVNQGQQYIKCIATDSRGQRTEILMQINVEGYSSPVLSAVSLHRCDASGNASDAGTYLYVAATAGYSKLAGKNALALRVQYSPNGASSQTVVALADGSGTVVGNGLIRIDRSYTATLIAVDLIGREASFSTTLSTAYATYNAKPGGKGFSFGKYAEKDNLLDVAWDINSDGDINAAGTMHGAVGQFPDIVGDSITTKHLNIGKTFIVPDENANSLLVRDEQENTISEFKPYGVSFGGFSSATGTDPKEEFHRRTVFYAGTDGIVRYGEAEAVPTGERWIDGKMIYAIVAALGTPAAGAETKVYTGVPAQARGEVLDVRGIAYTDGGWAHPLPYVRMADAGLHIQLEAGSDDGGLFLSVFPGAKVRMTGGYGVMELTMEDEYENILLNALYDEAGARLTDENNVILTI